MKKLFLMFMILACCFGPVGLGLAFADYTITFDEGTADDSGDPIDDRYDSLGIHFVTDTTSLTNPAVLYEGCTILPEGSNNTIFWYPTTPADYPYPATQYLGMEKAADDGVISGVALQFDSQCTKLEFLGRRPGSNDTSADVTISYFDTTQSDTPFFTEKVTFYVYTPTEEDPDGDGWKEYASDLSESFNLVTLSVNKKFALDNLTVTTVSDGTGDDSGDSSDPTDQTAASTDDGGDDDGNCFIKSMYR